MFERERLLVLKSANFSTGFRDISSLAHRSLSLNKNQERGIKNQPRGLVSGDGWSPKEGRISKSLFLSVQKLASNSIYKMEGDAVYMTANTLRHCYLDSERLEAVPHCENWKRRAEYR